MVLGNFLLPCFYTDYCLMPLTLTMMPTPTLLNQWPLSTHSTPADPVRGVKEITMCISFVAPNIYG